MQLEGRFHHSSRCSPCKLLSSPLLANPPTLPHYSCALRACGHVITSVLTARPQFLDPLVLSLFLSPAERRREEVFSCSCEAALPAWLPGSQLPTTPQEPYYLRWVVKGLLLVFTMATRALQLPTMFVSPVREQKQQWWLSPGWQTCHTKSHSSYSCLRIYYVLTTWHIFPFNLCNSRTKSVLLPTAFLQLKKLPEFLQLLRGKARE